MTEYVNRPKQILQVSPFVGYKFKDTATTSPHNQVGIFTPVFDDPLQNISLSKMRKNLYCLENPEVFDDVPEGKIKYQANNTFILKNPKAKLLQKRISGFRLEDLPDSVREKYERTNTLPEEVAKPTADNDEIPECGLKTEPNDYKPARTLDEPPIDLPPIEKAGIIALFNYKVPT